LTNRYALRQSLQVVFRSLKVFKPVEQFSGAIERCLRCLHVLAANDSPQVSQRHQQRSGFVLDPIADYHVLQIVPKVLKRLIAADAREKMVD
jgi:hypothetical protein